MPSENQQSEWIQAQQLLKRYDCTRDQPSDLDLESVRQALKLVTSYADYLTIGVCADSGEQGIRALYQFLKALADPVDLEVEAGEDPCFIKFNTKSQLCYQEAYLGSYRGVLITCHSALEDDYRGTYGHFPCDLFGASET